MFLRTAGESKRRQQLTQIIAATARCGTNQIIGDHTWPGQSGLELDVARRTREGNHIADVGHARNELDDTLEAQAKPRMRHRPVPPQIEVPPVLFGIETVLLHASAE